MIDTSIFTTRTIKDSEYDQWIMDLQLSGVPVNGALLWAKGEFTWISPDVGGEPAVTKIKIRKH